MNWYYIDGPLRVGPLNEREWADLVRAGKIAPETLVWHEGMEKWTPYRQIAPEIEPPEVEAEEEPLPETPVAYAARVADADFSVRFGDCVSRGWAVFKRYFWFSVGATLLILVLVGLGSSIPVIGFIVQMALQGVFLGGLYLVFLRLIRGETAEISDLFAGFSTEYFKPLSLQTLVLYFVTQLCFLPVLIAFAMKGITMKNFESVVSNDSQTGLVLLLVVLACSIPAIYFAFCWVFSIPLIIDKKLPFWPAMQLSRAKVLQHPWRVGWLVVVAGFLSCLGAIGFIVGIFVTLPLYYLIVLHLYEDIFNRPKENPGKESAPRE